MIPARFRDTYDPEPDYELEDMRRYAREEDERRRELPMVCARCGGRLSEDDFVTTLAVGRAHTDCAVRGEGAGRISSVYRKGGGHG